MDPNLIYSRYRDDFLAEQFSADKYSAFVAMPFQDRFSYRSDDVYRNVIQKAAEAANALLRSEPVSFGGRLFDTPRRIDDTGQTGRSIGDELIKAILQAHVTVADLTFANDGVMLEVGASLAFKPTQHIILLTQGKASELHFDIKGNVIIEYSPDGKLDRIANAMVAAVRDFESHRKTYLTHLSRELSRDAIWLLNWYGRLRNGRMLDQHGEVLTVSLIEDAGWQAFLPQPPRDRVQSPSDAQQAGCMVRFQFALRELLARRLMWTDYKSQTESGDVCSHRGTKLGWMFINYKWNDLICPPDESIEE